MAIQNFLSGGFYGSIGELTGRRWKNKRVVQAKFKPANPKTQAQEEQRRLFTRGSALAKIAQQVNWKAPQFENPIRTDWNQRQTVAINALKNGASEWEALPLAPTDFKAQHIIGECELVGINENKEMKLFLQGTNLLTDKKYACAIFIQSGEKKGQIIVGSGTTDLEVSNYATIRLPESDGIEGEECYIKIASYGDTDVDTVTLSAGLYLQQQTLPPYEFNITYQGVDYNTSDTLTIKIKIGDEAIEEYDAIKNINVRIYGHYWTKATYIKDSVMNEGNWTAIDRVLQIDRYSVAKSSATVTLYSTEAFLKTVEKWETKLDISFDAVEVKSENTIENSENVQLAAQEFPEYLPNVPRTQPYSFNPKMQSAQYNSNGTVTISVKIGDEAITNYDSFMDTSVVLTGQAWTKETAVNDDILDTDNWNDIQEQLTVTRTTVSKTTATVTFACSFANAYLYEKYAAKIDISFTANNVKGAESLENTKKLELLSQDMPEYLQEEIPNDDYLELVSQENTAVQIDGVWIMAGDIYSGEDTEDSGKLLWISKDIDAYEENDGDLESITLQDNTTYSGDSLEELIGDYGFDYRTDGHVIGWGIADKDIKNFTGNLYSTLQIENGKVAFKGYRVAKIPKDDSGYELINISF